MSRYIEEKDVYKLVEPNGVARVHCSQIDDLPRADVVEVVRCKDCVYSFMSISGETVLYCDMRPSDDHLELNKDYYCADGERREE